jgi:hypothetical protein
MGKKSGSGSGSGINCRIIFPTAYKPLFWVKIFKLLDADLGSGMKTFRIREGKKSDPVSEINFKDPQH